MQNTYKLLSLLLDYPNAEIKENLPEVIDIIKEEGYLNASQRNSLQQFIDYAEGLTLAGWQMQYVQLFDFSSNGNLYLFDHVYGDSRERGQAMVDLTEMYTQSGFMPCSNELPDYLPLFLEYIALQNNAANSAKLLKEISHILLNMKTQLEKKETPYVFLLGILCSLADPVASINNEKKGVEV